MIYCILLTLNIVIEAIKVLSGSGTFLFYERQAATVIIKLLVDFLYILKDKHPYSNSKIIKDMDVFYTIMEFLIPNEYFPSAGLQKKYSESELTRELNALPSRECLNRIFSEDNQMTEETYELLRKRLESRPPFVFYFNPNIEIQGEMFYSYYSKGFFTEETNVSVNE